MKNDRKGGASQRCLPATCRHDPNPKSHKKHPEARSERWRGIGVRIEDDVLVTKSGYRILSTGVPKTVSEIEAFMSEMTH